MYSSAIHREADDMKLTTLFLLSWGLIDISYAQRFPFVVPRLPGIISPQTLINNVNKVAGNLIDSVDYTLNLVQFTRSGVNFNNIVDLIIQGLRVIIRASHLDQVPLPGVNWRFNRRVGPNQTIDVGFKANRGYLKDLSTIRRTDNTTVTFSGRNITLRTGLGLDLLDAGYENYEFDSNIFRTRGMVDGRIGSNSAAVNLTIRFINLFNCSVILDDLKIVGFDGIAVNLAGLRDFNQPVSAFMTFILRITKDILMIIAEERATKFLRDMLDQFNCRNIISLLLPV